MELPKNAVKKRLLLLVRVYDLRKSASFNAAVGMYFWVKKTCPSLFWCKVVFMPSGFTRSATCPNKPSGNKTLVRKNKQTAFIFLSLVIYNTLLDSFATKTRRHKARLTTKYTLRVFEPLWQKIKTSDSVDLQTKVFEC